MIYGHSAFQKLFRMESGLEMRFGSSWGQVDALFGINIQNWEKRCVQW